MTIPVVTAPDWSLEAFCAQQHEQYVLAHDQEWNSLHPSAKDFLEKLDLPSLHPFCTHPEETLLHPMPPPMGPTSDFDASTVWEAMGTAFWYHVAPAAALTYLNAVLIAIYVAPIGLIWLLSRIFWICRHNYCKVDTSWTIQTEILFHLTLFFSWIVVTDDQYVLGIGRGLGVGLVGGLLLVALTLLSTKLSYPMFLHRVFLVLILCSFVSPWTLWDTEEIYTNIQPGLYYDRENMLIRQTVDRWNETLPDYAHIATPWQWTGDARTGLPYLMNHIETCNFQRVWLPTVDNEYVALDIAFPSKGHNSSNPLYLVLHGLNGGSEEGYVLDFVSSRTKAGSTVVVMVARGLMNTPIQGWTVRAS